MKLVVESPGQCPQPVPANGDTERSVDAVATTVEKRDGAEDSVVLAI